MLAELISLIVLLVAPLILSTAGVSWGTKVARLAIVAVVCALVISPWAIYNSTRFDRNVPLSTGFGSAMLQGNCPATYSGPLLGSFKLGCALLAKNASKDPSVADGQNRHTALRYMRCACVARFPSSSRRGSGGRSASTGRSRSCISRAIA